jgi:hypothetical protein
VAAFPHHASRFFGLLSTRDCCDDLAVILTGARDRRNDAMPHADWRLPQAYDHAQKLEPSGFAWECLRRNPDYHRDYRELAHSVPDLFVITAFRSKWGLSFRG